MAIQQPNTPSLSSQESAFHICPQCRDGLAAGLDKRGFPALCANCRKRPSRRKRGRR